jgi:hypothetical protein
VELYDLIGRVPTFHRMSKIDQIKLVGWHLHVHRGKETFSNDDLRASFRSAHIDPPDVSIYLPRMADKGKQLVIKARGGYKLSGTARRELDAKYGDHPVAVQTSQTLRTLPDLIPDIEEREFLQEALSCYQVGAFRAAVVMTWNLAYDHLVGWVSRDPVRLSAFNAAIPRRYPKLGIVIATRADFEKLKESETLELCSTAGLISKNVTTILKEKLARRNIAAHPSGVKITQSQADDAVSDLINNVVLLLR